jgi:hypothetical protein
MDRQTICLRVAMRLIFFLKNFLFEGSTFLIDVFLNYECGVYDVDARCLSCLWAVDATTRLAEYLPLLVMMNHVVNYFA